MAPMMSEKKHITMKPFVMKPFTKPLSSHFPSTRTNIAILAVFLIYAILHHHQHNPSSTLRIASFRPSSTESSRSAQTSHHSTADHPNLPSSLLTVLPPVTPTVHNFTVPHLTSFYYDTLSNGSTKLFLITSGIMMGFSQRNFSAVACLVGDDVYPARAFLGEVVQCIITRRLTQGERLAPVLAYDEPLRTAEAGPVKLTTGVIAQLFPGDITPLPDHVVLRGSLSAQDPSQFRVARSEHHVGPSDNFEYGTEKFKPRYQLCQMTMVAPNSHMIDDWANYHRRIGVDMIYIFDNGASLDLQDIYKDRPDIEVIQWPYHKSQSQVVSTFLLMSRARCERVFMHDSDEYAMFGLGDGSCLTTGVRPMIRYSNMAMNKGFNNVKLLYINMANSGFLRRPKGVVPLNYIHRRNSIPFRNGKTICHVDGTHWDAGSIHQCGWGGGIKVAAYKERISEWGQLKMRPTEIDDPPFLLHFRERSWEEWIEKWDAGRVSGKLVADEKAGTFTMENPDKFFLQTRPENRYAHFRDNVYKRVMKEGRNDEQIIVQTKNGERCEMLYKIVDKSVTGPVRERCVSEK